MPPQTAAPNWWADVQEHRHELDERARRAVEWSDDDFDLVPASVGRRRPEDMLVERVERTSPRRFERHDEPADELSTRRQERREAEQVREIPARREEAPRRELHVVEDTYEPDFAAETISEPAPAGERRTVRITGNPGTQRRGMVEIERRRPPRSVAERATHRPDRIAMWAAAFGFLLILIAAMSASPGA